MEFMVDTINLEAIRKYQKILPLAGVTSNPSIVKQAGKIDFFAQMKEIKKTIGQASLHYLYRISRLPSDCGRCRLFSAVL